MQAVRYGIMLSTALHMKVDRTLYFDRKNYFYPDLPKGYQITQQDRPIGSHGYLDVTLDDGTPMRVDIQRAHLEE
ncbi:MAG TPA: Asp-tRNA(Asn)/Glu-tRNA(Gln) amidotransferase GatCAB subunit B, partial [Firmicutes bacterium]|nr:Asp-tRNA(Asn)/Glu-tRNA(Gln) amidotransferase GatCAB subunit B [Bacillota bacterium]